MYLEELENNNSFTVILSNPSGVKSITLLLDFNNL